MMVTRKEQTKIKVLFVIHDLSVGGAEKVLVNLVNHMDYLKFDITVLALFDEGVNKQFLNENITYRYMFKHMIRGNSQLMKVLSPQKLYQWVIRDSYDIIVSYLEGPTARIVSGCPKGNTKTVSWIHCTFHNEKELAKSFRSIKEAKECYRTADCMVFVSEEVKQAFLEICPVRGKTKVLYNTNETDLIVSKAKEEIKEGIFLQDTFFWCGVGKIVQNKGFDRMLRIQKRLLKEGYSVHLLILGTGQQEEELKKWCIENDIMDSVSFLGYKTNPYKYVSKCDLFVCASYAEGFSTAATEALITGTPVCTVRVSGMTEMLGAENEFGVIVENDEEALYKAVKKLIDDPQLLEYYKEKSLQRGEKFSTTETVNAVQNMLMRLVER